MAATGFAWFAGNFATADLGPLDWLAAHALYLYRGPLVHLVLSYPRGRLAGRVERAAVAVGYVAAIVTPAWRSGTATIVLASLLVGVAGRSYLRAAGRERRERLAALQATAFLGAVLAGDALVRLAVSTPDAKDATLLANEAALVVLAVSLLAGLLRWPWERAEVTDFVVELGEARSGTLRDALARALGDPTLELGYWLPETGAYVDVAGRPLELPATGSDRAVTRVERDGQAVALLVHDPAVLDDPGLVEAVAAAARLAASNARLQAEVRAQVSELQESRRRLVRAGDEERRRLEQRLRDGAERRLVALGHVLERVVGKRESQQDRGNRACQGSARPRACRSPRPRRGPPPAGADRARTRGRACFARAEKPGARRAGGAGRAPPGGGRGCRLLRLLGGTRERRQVRVCLTCGRARDCGRSARRWSRSSTTVSAARIPHRALASAGWRTESRRSVAPSASKARPASEHASPPRFPSAVSRAKPSGDVSHRRADPPPRLA